MGGRRAGGARQRPDHPLRSRRRNHAYDPAQSAVRQRHVHGPRRQVGVVRRNLGLPRKPLLARGPKSGNDRDRHCRPSWIPRQHQSRIRRNLLGGARGDPDAELRSRDDHAGVQATHGAAGRRGRMAVPERKRRMRRSFRRGGPRAGNSMGPRRRKPSGDHLDARASRLSLSRRRHQQPHRPASSSPAPIRTGQGRRPIGASAR